jgi:hypothetical protein
VVCVTRLDEIAGASLTGGGLQMFKGRVLLSDATKKAKAASLAERKRAAGWRASSSPASRSPCAAPPTG